MPTDAYDKVTFRGRTVNKRTRAALLEVEKKLGYELTIVQGSYNKGVAASAGTHDGGGVVDLTAYDYKKKLRALKDVGFAAWHRTPAQGFSEHIHACLTGDREMAPLAESQCEGYLQGRDGLGPWPFGPDGSYRPDPEVRFDYRAWKATQARALRVKLSVRKAITWLQLARKNSDTAKERASYTKAIKDLRKDH